MDRAAAVEAAAGTIDQVNRRLVAAGDQQVAPLEIVVREACRVQRARDVGDLPGNLFDPAAVAKTRVLGTRHHGQIERV